MDLSASAVLGEVAAQLAVFEALLLILSAAHKLVSGARSRDVIRQFVGVPDWLAAPALAVAIVAESAAGVLLMMPPSRTAGAVLAGTILAVYLVLVLRALLQGRRDVDCGCSFGKSHGQLSSYTVWRNAALLAISVLIAQAPATGVLPWQGSQLLVACALMALYGALDQTMTLRPLRSGVLQ